jgi:hypothetical protein
MKGLEYTGIVHLTIEIRTSDLTDQKQGKLTMTLDTDNIQYSGQKHPLPTPELEPPQF